MNILYIGEETRNWIVNLVNELVLLGHTVTAVVKRYDEYDDANKVPAIDGCTLVEVDNDAYFKPDTVVNALDNIEQYDIVFGSHIIALIPVKYIGERYNIPYGIQVLDVPIDLMNADSRRMSNWKYYANALSDVSTMTFITKRARDDWKVLTGQYYDDTHVITYPISIPEEHKLSGLDKDDNYIVSFCRVTPVKNVSQATKSLIQLKNDTKQVVVGKNQGDLDHIRDNVIYIEQVTEEKKFDLIKNASVVVYPQATEYIGGLSPWEAMYIGTPVLVYDYGILKELYGDNAFYADKDVADSYTHELAYLLNVKHKFIKSKLVAASDYASKNSYANAAKKLERVLIQAI